jgi:XTP/dITP diphosphohydrolase
VGEPIEDGLTFEENAAIKARAGLGATGLPTLADRLRSRGRGARGRARGPDRRYAGENATDDDNNRKLLGELEGLPSDRRGARYVCSLVLAMPDER